MLWTIGEELWYNEKTKQHSFRKGYAMIYRQEHPKPQFERKNWINLNGEWQFEIDRVNSGVNRGLMNDDVILKDTITVPFCPQSELSGINDKEFMFSVWYKKTVNITEEQLRGKVFLHFGAVDYDSFIYVNGVLCGKHKGGYVSFKVDVTDHLRVGDNILCVHAQDDERSPAIPSGKQCFEYYSGGCHYTRTTGIWQTVWLEFCPKTHIEKVKYFTDAENAVLTVTAQLCGAGTFTAKASYEGTDCGSASLTSKGGQVTLTLPLTEKHLWELGKGGLYDLILTYGEDEVKSYFGLRTIEYTDKKFFLNGKSVFQRLVLDQGFYPDGIYTAPTDDELAADIDRSMAMGFNGARLHEKVFEERFLYHADRKGYMVWGEFPNWGFDHTDGSKVYGFLPEWLEEVERDFNHPSIVGWCPFNETWPQEGRLQSDELLALVYQATKSADPTRPCLDTSGSVHVATDVFDIHDYEQRPEVFATRWAEVEKTGVWPDCVPQHYNGKLPFFVSEYGGIQWTDKGGWGYGNAPKTEEEFLSRLKGLTDILLDNPNIFALCYTQLTDVEQEQNGLYTYERKPKFDPSIIYPIFTKKAAVEE